MRYDPNRSLISLPNSVCLSVCRTHAHYSLWHAHYCPLILFIENWTHDGDRIPTCSRDVLNTASSSTSTDAKISGIQKCKFWSAPWKLRCLFYAVTVTFDLTAHRCYSGAFHTWVTLCMYCGHVVICWPNNPLYGAQCCWRTFISNDQSVTAGVTSPMFSTVSATARYRTSAR